MRLKAVGNGGWGGGAMEGRGALMEGGRAMEELEETGLDKA